MKKILLIISMVAFITPISAQIGTFAISRSSTDSDAAVLTGTVTDSKTKKPIDLVIIELYNNQGKRVGMNQTGKDGKFSILVYKGGEYKLLIKVMGYKNETKILTIKEKSYLNVGIIKLTEGTELNEIVVSAKKPIITNSPDGMVYDVEQDPDRMKVRMTGIFEKIPFLKFNFSGKIEYKNDKRYVILVNGKVNEMISSERQFPMRLINAEYMKTIEILSPPPPPYDEQGYEYVINIILSKPLPDGFVCETTGTGATDNTWSLSPEFVVKIKSQILALKYTGSYNNLPSLASKSYRENYLSEESRYSNSETVSDSYGKNHSFTISGNNDIKSSVTFRYSLSTSFSDRTNIADIRNETRSVENSPVMTISSHSVNNSKSVPRINGAFTMSKRSVDSRKIVLFNYSLTNSTLNSNLLNDRETLPQISSYSQITNENRSTLQHQFSLQASNRLNKQHMFTSRTQFSFRDYSSESDYLTLYPINIFSTLSSDDSYKGLFYIQRVLSQGINYRLTYNKLGLVANLTGEYVANTGRYTANSDNSVIINRKEFNLLPQLSISYRIKRVDLRFSYKESVSRPGAEVLNPYVNNTDPLNISYGNPSLKSEKARSINLNSVSFIFPIFVQFGSSYSNTANSIERITTIDENNISYTTYGNIGSKSGISVSAGISYMTQSFSVSNAFIYSKNFYSVGNYSSSSSNIQNTVDLQWTITKRAAVSSKFSFSKNELGPQSLGSNFQTDYSFGANYQIIKGSLIGTVSIVKPFENRQTIVTERGDDTFYFKEEKQRLGRVLTFSLRWNFGWLKQRSLQTEGPDFSDIKSE